MKLRNLILAIVVLLALAGTLYWSEHRKPEDAAKPNPETPTILKVDQASVTKIELRRKDSEPIILAKSSSGVWQITQPKPLSADQGAVGGELSALSPLESSRVVEDKASDLKPYGLDHPATEIVITEKDNKSHTLLIGDDTPTGNTAYAMLSGDPRVFTLASYTKNGIDKSLNDLRDKRLMPVAADKVSRVELVKKDGALEFGRDKEDWQILKPGPFRANSFQVTELVSKVTDAQMDLTGGDSNSKEIAASFAHATPVATAKVTDPSGVHELEVRQNNGTYLAKSSSVDGIYKVSADLGQAVAKSLDDFRAKKLFDFSFREPNKIELHDGAKSISLMRNGEDWWSNGKKMDAESVLQLVSNLRNIGTDKYVDSGFANPQMDVTVTSDDGKRVEKISFAKISDGYIAKRDNEPALYHVQNASVSAVQQAAEGVKPAAAK